MQTTGRVFDDIARVASGAAGALSGVREEIEGLIKHRLERMVSEMDLVTREEFEAVKAVAAKARTEQEHLEAKVAELEAALAASQKPAKPRKSPASKKTESS